MYSRIRSATDIDTVNSAHATVSPRLLLDELLLSGEGVDNGDEVLGDGEDGDRVPGLGVVEAEVGAGVCAITELNEARERGGVVATTKP